MWGWQGSAAAGFIAPTRGEAGPVDPEHASAAAQHDAQPMQVCFPHLEARLILSKYDQYGLELCQAKLFMTDSPLLCQQHGPPDSDL